MGLYKCCSKIRLGADKIWDSSLWWLGRALQRLLCLAQEVDWFSKFKTEKTGLGISGPGYVLLLQYSALVMLTVCAWQCLLPLAGSYGAVFAALAQCWVLVFGVCPCTAMPVAGMGSLGCGVGAGRGQSSAVGVPGLWLLHNLHLVGNAPRLSGASCAPQLSWLLLSCSSGNFSPRRSFS